jgi:uncharacterized OB-fold protein
MIPGLQAFSLTECGSCGARISPIARSCPHCGAPNQWHKAVIGGAIAALLIIGTVVAFTVYAFRAKQGPGAVSEAVAPPAPGATPGEGASDYGWIVQAMADCEEEAKRTVETLSFLIVPVSKTDMSLPGWSPMPIGTMGSSVVLLNSTDALIGLRNRALELYDKPVAFTVSDPATSTVYKWKASVGVTALKTRAAGLDNLKLGFEIPQVAEGVEWGPTVKVERGTCYWINPLIRAAARSG